MRQTVGGTWLFQLVILFIFLFAGYIIMTTNYSKVVKVKNETIGLIERYEGLNPSSITLVNNYLISSAYREVGSCYSPNGTNIYGATSLDSNVLEQAQKGKKYYYCVKKFSGVGLTNYYQVTLFYNFSLPVIGSTAGYNVKGTTSNFLANDAAGYEVYRAI